MKEYTISQLMAQEGVQRAIQRYGLEGTEQKIKEVYSLMPKTRDIMLEEYKKLIWRK